MKEIFLYALCMLTLCTVSAQQRISKKELDLLNKNLSASPLLLDDPDFLENRNPNSKWNEESAIILCQKTSFDFDQKGLSAGRRIGRNIWGLVFALPSLGQSILWANWNNDTRMLIEEKERLKLILQDKYALDQFSVLYFRLSTEGDAFAARVIKKDGSIQKLDLGEAIKIDDIKTVPSLFTSYTDEKFTSIYRPDYFKIAVSNVEEGDIIEYEFININTRRYAFNPQYKEFHPIYYLCNRPLPIVKQSIEVATKDDKYHLSYKSLKGAPEFTESSSGGKKIYKWTDNNRDRLTDTRYVNQYLQLPSVKFQMVYARNGSKDLIWFDSNADKNQDITEAMLEEKAKAFWFRSQNLQSTGDYAAGLSSDIGSTVKSMYKECKKKGFNNLSDDEYIRKIYYYIRSKTLYSNWSDYAFAKVFSGLLNEKKIDHDIVVSASNQRTGLNTVAFAPELSWSIRYKNRFYVNPDEHLNPEEIPGHLAGNASIQFNSNNEKRKMASEPLPASDTLVNSLVSAISVSMDPANPGVLVDKTVEATGLVKSDLIDDILLQTPFMENDFRNYDGSGMWEGLSEKDEEKARADFMQQKKEWKEEKPKMMKAFAQRTYSMEVAKYNNFRLIQDGRNHKKGSLKYSESFILNDMQAKAGDDIIIALPVLVGRQPKIKKEEHVRSLPVDVGYPYTLRWNIQFVIPAGYTVKGVEGLNKMIANETGAFTSTAKIENNTLLLLVTKVYRQKNMEAVQWPLIEEILNTAYSFSQGKIILKKL